MGEIHRLPDPARTEQEAADWFARMNADDVTADDRARFEAWLHANPVHEKAYDELCGTWTELRKAGPLVRAVSFGQAMNAATAPSRPQAKRWLAGAIAAAVSVIAVAVGWNLFKQQETSRFQTAVGEQAAVALPDGSSFDLNTDSRIQVSYSKRARVVYLERGEAFFKVAHDPQRPFWVHAGDRWVRAVGTAFNVYLRPAGAEVTVSEGTVNLVNSTTATPPTDLKRSLVCWMPLPLRIASTTWWTTKLRTSPLCLHLLENRRPTAPMPRGRELSTRCWMVGGYAKISGSNRSSHAWRMRLPPCD